MKSLFVAAIAVVLVGIILGICFYYRLIANSEDCIVQPLTARPLSNNATTERPKQDGDGASDRDALASIPNLIGALQQAKNDCENKARRIKQQLTQLNIKATDGVFITATQLYGAAMSAHNSVIAQFSAAVTEQDGKVTRDQMKNAVAAADKARDAFLPWTQKVTPGGKGKVGIVLKMPEITIGDVVKAVADQLTSTFSTTVELLMKASQQRHDQLLDELNKCKMQSWDSL